eukprot:scaffold56861_cov18-Tisochrysis_lutea.AAC.1
MVAMHAASRTLFFMDLGDDVSAITVPCILTQVRIFGLLCAVLCATRVGCCLMIYGHNTCSNKDLNGASAITVPCILPQARVFGAMRYTCWVCCLLYGHNTCSNKDLFFKDLSDGASAIKIGVFSSNDRPLAFVGGNCSLQASICVWLSSA